MKNEVMNIIHSIIGRNIILRRIEALELAGYTVKYDGKRWNFGTSGTVKEEGDHVLAQLSCAVSRKSRKTGYTLNACDVYKVSKK